MEELLDTAPCGFLSLSDDGTILRANATLGVLLGYESGDLHGLPFHMILAAGGRVFCQTHLFPLLLLHGKAEEIYLSLRSRAGADVPILLCAVRRELAPDAANGGVNDCVFIPIHRRLRFEEELLQTKKAAEEAAAEAMRANAREHLIAVQLQQALQPELPATTPGIALTRYFEPALRLSEGVGGDFYDVFALTGDDTALVVGDLSGKGLAAAAQVATVRNMLRAFLYTKPALAEAITTLNLTLAERDLLNGFTTLFVGIYDGNSRTLRYVSCGQEPALVRRAGTGRVQELGPTGPILGAFPDAEYAEESISLLPGDALAVFTDGLTEVGETRRSMLGIEGVVAAFAMPLPGEESDRAEEVAERLMLRMIASVDAAAKDGIRDDVCLLVGVVSC